LTSIDFYFNAGDRLQVACRLAAKAAAQRRSLLVYAPDGDTASRLDKLLWTWPATGFVPHCPLHDPLAPETPVLIAADDEAPPRCELLLNLAAACPPHFERFERLLELVGADEAERAAGRERYRYYRSRGYAIAHHDLGQHNEAAG
jgi:DNA polymerase-3 subunit chi